MVGRPSHGLDYSAYRRFARSGLGYRSEIHPRFYPADAEHHHHRRDGGQHVAVGQRHENAARRHLYAVWTGIGAVGAAIMGMVLLGESTNIARIISLCLIVVGILGLKFSSH